MKIQILIDCYRKAVKLNNRHPEKLTKGYHHFSFIIQNNKIISYGFNRGENVKPLYGYKSHQKLHSENTSYFKAKGLLNKKSFEVVNIRLTKTGKIKISKPCNCCVNFLINLGCTSIWFTTGCPIYMWAKLNIC